jgi:hypothetical protein
MMNTRIATLHIPTNPLFNPKPINACPATAINTEAVRSFFLPTRYKLWGTSANRQRERQVIGVNLDQKNRRKSHDDIHNSDEDRDIGTQLRNNVGKDIVTVI